MVVDEYVRALPHAALRPVVGFYTGYRQRSVSPGRHRGLPSPYLTLIFTMDDPLVVAAHRDPGQRPTVDFNARRVQALPAAQAGLDAGLATVCSGSTLQKWNADKNIVDAMALKDVGEAPRVAGN
jgi:hypothetical protein